MTEWYVKDLSKLTGVSVQTLHHYDRIGLLKPSIRLMNGYRIYSEKDLLRLQQIIALKFFGFKLAHIKGLLLGHISPQEHFSVQAALLEQKANKLLEASAILKSIIVDVPGNKSIAWKTIIKLIEVYRMTEELEHSWVKEIFTSEELKQYATFEMEWKKKSTVQQKEDFENEWAKLIADINQNLKSDPASLLGIAIGKKCMTLINGVYGKKYAHLRTKKFEKGFVEGKGLDEVGLTLESVTWLDKAIDAYWRDRLYGVLDQVGTGISDEAIFHLWKDILDDMYGDDESRKKELYDAALADERVSEKAKEWLKILRKLIATNRHLL